MVIINLTPHVVTEVTTGESIPPSGGIARVKSSSELISSIDGIPVYRTVFGEVEGLPQPKKDTWYIVSGMVLGLTGREDLLAPGELVRNQEGQPIGCRGFRTN